jgi:hypothetical protein
MIEVDTKICEFAVIFNTHAFTLELCVRGRSGILCLLAAKQVAATAYDTLKRPRKNELN